MDIFLTVSNNRKVRMFLFAQFLRWNKLQKEFFVAFIYDDCIACSSQACLLGQDDGGKMMWLVILPLNFAILPHIDLKLIYWMFICRKWGSEKWGTIKQWFLSCCRLWYVRTFGRQPVATGARSLFTSPLCQYTPAVAVLIKRLVILKYLKPRWGVMSKNRQMSIQKTWADIYRFSRRIRKQIGNVRSRNG